MSATDELVAAFEEHRAHLRALAFRMLGSRGDAEDAVQEAWVRLARSDAGAIDNLGGWLTTVVSRICLNVLRSRQARPELPIELRWPEPVLEPADPGRQADPEQEALVADEVGLALLVVLETLTPGERLAFVLHDVFSVPFEEIATMVDRSPEAARQLASRARRRVRQSAPEPDTGLVAQREVVEAFYEASRSGDFARLVAVLHEDVVLRVDHGAGAVLVVEGSEGVAGRAQTFADPARKVRPATVNGVAGAVITMGGGPVAVMAFTVRAGRVAAIDVLAGKDRLAELDLSGPDA